MACVNPDGTLSPSARTLLRAADALRTPAELAQQTGLPLFRIRASVRELIEAGLLQEENGRYQRTAAAEALLDK
jgi:DNA-binding IclR family transcriptional regulator